MKYNCSIIKQLNLPNDYQQITVTTPDFQPSKPGQLVTIANGFTCPIYDHQGKHLSLLLPPQQTAWLGSQTTLQLSKPFGTPLPQPTLAQPTLLLTRSNALSACVFYLKIYKKNFKGLVLLEHVVPSAFTPCPSRFMVPGVPNDVIAACPLLEDWSIPSRLASKTLLPGCFHGTVDELAEQWLSQQSSSSGFDVLKVDGKFTRPSFDTTN